MKFCMYMFAKCFIKKIFLRMGIVDSKINWILSIWGFAKPHISNVLAKEFFNFFLQLTCHESAIQILVIFKLLVIYVVLQTTGSLFHQIYKY